MKQLIAQFAIKRGCFQTQKTANFGKSRSFSLTRIFQPIIKCRAEWFVPLSLDHAGDSSFVVAQQGKNIILTVARSSRQWNFVFGDSKKQTGLWE